MAEIYFMIEILGKCFQLYKQKPYFICPQSFRYVSTLREKVFSTTSMKLFLFRPQKYSDSFIFANAGLSEKG